MRAPSPQTPGVSTPRTDPTPSRTRTAQGTAPPPRRRGGAEEPIESGEIVEKRSLVIRSKVEWNEGPTDVAATPIELPKRNWRWLWLVGAIVWSIAAFAFVMRARPDRSGVDALSTRAEMLATTLDGEARAAQVRADALAASPVLRAAIETDASTLADMWHDRNIAFALRPGDVVEIFQLRGGTRSLLLRLPATAKPLDAPAAGQVRLDSANLHAVVVASAPIANERSKIAGEIIVSSPIDLSEATKRIAEYATGAVLVGLREPLTLVPSSARATVTIPITAKTPAAGALALEAVIDTGGGSLIGAWISMVIAALLLGVFAFSTVRARRA